MKAIEEEIGQCMGVLLTLETCCIIAILSIFTGLGCGLDEGFRALFFSSILIISSPALFEGSDHELKRQYTDMDGQWPVG